MLKNEDYKLIGIISTELTGKSTYIRDKIIRGGGYDWKQQRCVIVTESNPSAYDKYPRVETYRDLMRLKRGIVKFWDWNATDEYEMMHKLRQLLQQGYMQNGLLVLEDSTIYLTPNTPKEIRSMIISRRMFKIDVAVASHSFADYPKFLRRRTQIFAIGKMPERITDKKLDQLEYPNCEAIYMAYLKSQQSKDHFVKTVVTTGL